MFPLFLLFFYAASTQAVYYIDDRDSSVSFTPVNLWVQDPDGGAVDLTLTYAYCTTQDNCQIEIQFTGSGITLYVAHEKESVNVTTTVDNDPSTTMTTKLLNNSTIEEYNITLYNIQSLAYGSHEVTVMLLSWDMGGNSSVWFDYAAVNDTQPSNPSSSSPSTQPVYYIDDRNTSISYTPANSWVLDPDGGAFDETLTYAYCTTSDNCQIQIPFTGTGITLYIAHESDNVNATITVDGNPDSMTAQTLSGDAPVESYNVTLYNIQSLALGSHEATVQLLSYTGGQSSLWFDYAAVLAPNGPASPGSSASSNPTASSNPPTSSNPPPSNPTSSSNPPTSSNPPPSNPTSSSNPPASNPTASSPSTSNSSHSHTSTGYITGGVVGGLAFLAGIVAVFY